MTELALSEIEDMARWMSDTGYFCRRVLRMDTDRDANTGEALSGEGAGGVRAHGPHQEVIAFLDDTTISHGLLMAPRYSYKSSIVQGFIMRMLVSRPNISILLVMHEQEIATTRCQQIRDALLTNPILQKWFPNMKGPMWQQDQFITGLRTDKTLQTPSLYVGSPQKIPTGTRPDLVVFDDIVSNINSRTEGGLKKGRETIEKCLALGSRTCRYLDVGTPYHYADAHHWCMDKPGWKKLIHLDVGFDVVVNEDKTMELVGDGRWENLPKPFLMKHLRGGMSFQEFMSQFKLRVVAGQQQVFARNHFQPIAWRAEFGNLTGYLLTDIAPSDKNENALNVLLYAGVSHDNRLYLLDLEVGHWLMYEYCQRYLDMVSRWSNRVNHRAEMWEEMLASHPYRQHILVKAKERNLRTNILWQTRNQSAAGKLPRIAALGVRFQGREVFVVDTMPRAWNDGTEVRTLWDPEAERGPIGNRLPGGDLVDWFIRFPHHPKLDVPDALSLINSEDKQTRERICFYVPPSKVYRPDVPKDPSDAVTPRTAVRGRNSSARFYDRASRRIG